VGKGATREPVAGCAVPLGIADRRLGTSVEWATNVSEAARQAARERKLVFLMHISGNFEILDFT
jgi:hypothetical protein